jgi:phospholipid/cholesterol/gamma-HCH transport system substrate-binding protein
VKRAIFAHRRDMLAIVLLVLLAAGMGGYILAHQPAFTLFRSYYVVRAQFSTAAAVNAGQGEAVTIAGVPIGSVGAVKLENGHALVSMDIDKRYAPIYTNATVLLRERTPLKDMYLSLDPGTPGAGRIRDGGTLAIAQTQPDVDIDQILGSLDADTRTYLLLALSGGAEALSGHASTALRAVFKRFPPLVHSTAAFTALLARRNADVRGAIHNLNLVAGALGDVNSQLGSLVDASDTDFTAISSEDSALQSALAQAPSALASTQSALTDVSAFTHTATPALTQLVPFAKALGPALEALAPLARQTNAGLRTKLIPFTTAVQPLSATLAPAAAKLAVAVPHLSSALGWVNQLLNALAHEPASGNSYLFWGAWLAHNADSIVSYQDADGAVTRSLFMASCPALNIIENELTLSQPSIGALLDLLNAPEATSIKASNCPPATSTSTGAEGTTQNAIAAATATTTTTTATPAAATATATPAAATTPAPPTS